jgi:hypothetical protein
MRWASRPIPSEESVPPVDPEGAFGELAWDAYHDPTWEKHAKKLLDRGFSVEIVEYWRQQRQWLTK